jgi:glycosyltransferase involved in cell wall biosynthesis
LRVLYVNHTSRVSGAERSLLDLIGGLPDHVSPVVACPEGRLAIALRQRGVAVHPITGTDGSLKLSPVRTSQAVWELGRTAMQVRSLVARERVDVVHANSIRAGMVCGAARGRAGVVAHVRDRLPPGRASAVSLQVMARGAQIVVANSHWTAAGLPGGAKIRVVYNPVDLDRFELGLDARASARAEFGAGGSGPILAVVAQITPWKGQEEAIRATRLLHDRGLRVRLLIVGDTEFLSSATRYDNRAYRARLDALVAECGLEGDVMFTGPREDVPRILAALDALLVPSWEEPFGRSVIEGMAAGLPVVATCVGGPAEIIQDGHDGLLVEPRRPDRLADAVAGLLEDDALRARIGAAANRRARDFGVENHVAAMLDVYAAARARV